MGIEEPTRKENTLDLMFTNEVSLVTMVEVTKSSYSDHGIIEMSTNYSLTEKEKYNTEQSEDIVTLGKTARGVKRPGGTFFFSKIYSFFTIAHIDLYYTPFEAEFSELFPCLI